MITQPKPNSSSSTRYFVPDDSRPTASKLSSSDSILEDNDESGCRKQKAETPVVCIWSRLDSSGAAFTIANIVLNGSVVDRSRSDLLRNRPTSVDPSPERVAVSVKLFYQLGDGKQIIRQLILLGVRKRRKTRLLFPSFEDPEWESVQWIR